MQLIGGTPVVFEVAGGDLHVGPSLRERFAVVARLELCHMLRALQDLARHLRQNAPALRRRDLAPGALEGLARRLDRAIDVFGLASRQGGECGPRAGREDRNGLTGRWIDPVSVDQQLIGDIFRFDCIHHCSADAARQKLAVSDFRGHAGVSSSRRRAIGYGRTRYRPSVPTPHVSKRPRDFEKYGLNVTAISPILVS